MLLTEWNIDDAKEVWQEEAFEEGLEQGKEEGHLKGLKEGWEKGQKKGFDKGRGEGIEQGREDEKQIIARNLLAKGSTPEFISDITGLSVEEIKQRLMQPAP